MFLPFILYATSPFPLDRFPQFWLAGLFVFIPNFPVPKIYCSAPFNHRALATLGNAPSLIKSKQELCYGVSVFSFHLFTIIVILTGIKEILRETR